MMLLSGEVEKRKRRKVLMYSLGKHIVLRVRVKGHCGPSQWLCVLIRRFFTVESHREERRTDKRYYLILNFFTPK